jgi:hypothetical protein
MANRNKPYHKLKKKRIKKTKKKSTASNSKPNINDSNQAAFLDMGQACVYAFFNSEALDFPTEVLRISKYLLDDTNSVFNQDEKIDGEAFLLAYFEACEVELKRIIEQYPIYDLLYWSRRLAPKNLFKVQQDLTVAYYRELLNNAIFKFGTSNTTGQKFENKSSSGQTQITISPDYVESAFANQGRSAQITKILSDIIRAEIISFFLTRGHQVYRIIAKGGIFTSSPFPPYFNCNTDEELGYLLDLYDERLERNSLLSLMGVSFSNNLQKGSAEYIIAFQLNVDHKIKFPILNLKGEGYKEFPDKSKPIMEYASNYVIVTLNLNEYLNYLLIYNDEFTSQNGFNPYQFCAALIYLNLKLINNINISWTGQLSILQRGYFVDSHLDEVKKDMLKYIGFIYSNIYGIAESIESYPIDKIIDYLKYDVNTNGEIDLWTRGPRKIICELGSDLLLYDYSGIALMLQHVTKTFAIADGELGNRKSKLYEEQIKREAEKIFGKSAVVLSSEKITNSNGESKEIDCAFVIDEILVLLEAKSVNVSFGFDKGTKKSIEFRNKKFQAALKESESKADFIQNLKDELDFLKKIKYIVPIVVSANAEYIWEKAESLFLDDAFKVPRILTIRDFGILKSLNLSNLAKKSFTRKIK